MSWVTIVTLSVIYGMCGAVVGARVATLAAWEGMRQTNEVWRRNLQAPTGEHWILGALIGLTAGVVWPGTAAVLVFRRAVFAPPLEIQAKRQAEYIAELERQLDSDHDATLSIEENDDPSAIGEQG